MRIEADSPKAYIDQLPEERKVAMTKLRQVILENLPEGFQETMSYGMIGYVIPHSVYPPRYHADPKLPLPFINLASQKNHVALYHMGLYADKELLNWFETEYAKKASTRLDMGKSCVRFKKVDAIPYELIGDLVKRMGAEQWITLYEKNIRKK